MQCSQCGARLQKPAAPPFVCNYCGEQQYMEAAAGQIWLTDEHVTAFLRQTLMGAESTWLHPSIPPKKNNNVRTLHGAHLPADELVLGLYDGTVFGSATDGFILTRGRVCWKNQLEQAQFLDWAHINPDDVSVEGTAITLGRAKLETLYSKKSPDLQAWQQAIQTLAVSARPAAARNGAASAAAPAAPIIDGKTERFVAPPYEDDGRSAGTVSVHPSGEVVAVASYDIVEVRRSSDGGRVWAGPLPGTGMVARFSPGGGLLAVGSGHRARLYDARTGRVLGKTHKLQDYCHEIAWLGSDQYFALGGQRGEVQIINASTMQLHLQLLGEDPDYTPLGGLAASADGGRLFVSLGSQLICFDSSGSMAWREAKGLPDGGMLSASPDGATLVGANYSGVAFFDGRTGRPANRFQFQCAKEVHWKVGGYDNDVSWSPKPAYSPDGATIAVQDHVGNLSFIEAHTGRLHPTPRARGRAWIEEIAWFADSNHVALAMSDNSLAVWTVRPLTEHLHVRAIDDLPEDTDYEVEED